MLLKRGLKRDVVEDSVQTAAERAYARRVDFSSSGELFAWCSVTAMRAALKVLRKDGRLELGGAADLSWPDDLETLASRRMALQALTAAIEGLAPGDLALLVGHADASDSDPRRDARQRHRLRARLAKVVDGVLGLIPGIFRQLRRRASGSGAAALGASVAGLVGGALAAIWSIHAPIPSPAAQMSLRPTVTPTLGRRPQPVDGSDAISGPHVFDQRRTLDSGHSGPALAVGLVAAGEPVGGRISRRSGDQPLVCTNVVPGPQPTCVAQPTDVLPPPPGLPVLGPKPP